MHSSQRYRYISVYDLSKNICFLIIVAEKISLPSTKDEVKIGKIETKNNAFFEVKFMTFKSLESSYLETQNKSHGNPKFLVLAVLPFIVKLVKLIIRNNCT
jgi:hypothetical protein